MYWIEHDRWYTVIKVNFTISGKIYFIFMNTSYIQVRFLKTGVWHDVVAEKQSSRYCNGHKFPAPPSIILKTFLRVNIDSEGYFRVQEDSQNYWPWVCRRLCRARDDARRGLGCQHWETQHQRPRVCFAFFHWPHPCFPE